VSPEISLTPADFDSDVHGRSIAVKEDIGIPSGGACIPAFWATEGFGLIGCKGRVHLYLS
jgi:hypothetical protein